MPTKKRLAIEREKALEQKRMAEIFNNLPKNITAHDLEVTRNLGYDEKTWNYIRTNLVKFDADGQPYRVAPHPEKKDNEKRRDFRRAEAARLKGLYPHFWGMPSGAKNIAILEEIDISKKDNLLRKIQKYFNDFP
jgi:hypothetical protein